MATRKERGVKFLLIILLTSKALNLNQYLAERESLPPKEIICLLHYELLFRSGRVHFKVHPYTHYPLIS